MSMTTDGYALGLTAQIVAAHVENNHVTADELPDLIKAVYRSVVAAATFEIEQIPQTPPQNPAVPVRQSVFPDYIVCLENGKKLKTLKRHLKVSYGLSPADYRAKWGLPLSYPMVAPNYAARRSGLAKSVGLGQRPAIKIFELEAQEVEAPDVTQMPARRARGLKG